MHFSDAHSFIYFVIIVTSHENSGNARGSLSSVGSDSPNPCNDNDGECFYFFILSFFYIRCSFRLNAFSVITIRLVSLALFVFVFLFFVWEEKSNRNTQNRIMISTFIQNDAHLRYLFKFQFYLRVFQWCDFGMFFPQLRYIFLSFFGVQMKETTLNANLIFSNAFFHIQFFMTRIFFSELWILVSAYDRWKKILSIFML